MKPQDIFGIILRTFAVWLIIWGLWNLGEAAGNGIEAVLEVLRVIESSSSSDFVYSLIFGIFSPLIGFAVLANADSITKWAYREKKASEIPPKLEK